MTDHPGHIRYMTKEELVAESLRHSSNSFQQKAALVGYMSNLLTLLEGQDTSGVYNRNQIIGDEFNRCWVEFKSILKKEREDGTRKAQQQRTESGADQPGSEPRSGGEHREHGGESQRG